MTEKELTDDELEQAAGALKDARAKESDLGSATVSGWPELTPQKPKPEIKSVSGLGSPSAGGETP